ncbi:MAG TPA: hypothetical protein DHV36_11690 [Desulfobacteraceae bacterium]|nr:hypothetical protein [Desulfobacteraceae bacterium]
MGLNRINKPEPLAKTALKALRNSILKNDLNPGVIYNEKALARDLGISRTPVREALLELSSKRLVKFLPQKGVVINTFSPKEIQDVFDVRMALQTYAIHKLCRQSPRVDTARVAASLKAQKEAARNNDARTFMDADRRFHMDLTTLARNNYLMEMMNDIRDIMHLMGYKALGLDGRMQQVIREHEIVLNAVAAGDAHAALEGMESHLAHSKAAVNQT